MQRYALIVIGAGAGGLVVAIGAAKAGKKVLLIEKGYFGGDCTNFGCIPSKALIASAKYAYYLKSGKHLGLNYDIPSFNATAALQRVRSIIKEVRSHEDPPALHEKGVDTLTGIASFLDPHTLEVVDTEGKTHQLRAKNIVIATGSHPFIPPIKGLKATPYLTNETIFDLKEIPKGLAILGAGPIGCELAGAFNRLGSEVFLIESMRGILPNEDQQVQKLMTKCFEKEKINMFIHCDANLISHEDGLFHICVKKNGEDVSIDAEHLLVSTGRRPNISELNLEKAEIIYNARGIPIDGYGRTNQKHIFAIGDVVGGPQFTHVAENQGRTVLTSLLLAPFKKKFDNQAIPRCTFTDPEVAHIGMLEKEAIKTYGEKSLAIYQISLNTVDRAITASRQEGFIKVVTKKWSGKILGASIVAPRAGEMLLEFSVAMKANLPLRKLANIIHPYPTYSGAIRTLSDLWLTQTIVPALKNLLKRK